MFHIDSCKNLTISWKCFFSSFENLKIYNFILVLLTEYENLNKDYLIFTITYNPMTITENENKVFVI